jgi:hypothetical protein
MHATVSIDGHTYQIPRAIGILNLTFAAFGLFQLILNLIGIHFLGPDFIREHAPYMTDRHRFFIMSGLTVGLLLPLGLCGIQLLRRKPHAVALCMILFVVEIVTFLGILWTWDLPFLDSPVLFALLIAVGVMNGGIAIQILTAYPLVGLILLMRETRRAHKAGG